LSGSIFRTVLAMSSGRSSRRGLAALFRPSASGRMAGDKIQRGVLAVAIVLLVAMVVVAVLLGLFSHDGGAGVTVFVLFAAAAAVGAGLGFLFGLPRARVSDLTADGSSEVPAPPAKASTYYLTNSNLIKVSDWLTTIVIGLGLVNLGRLVPAIRSLSHALEAPLGNAPYSGAIGVAVLVVGLLAGFILDYLWTSIRVRELLEESERQSEEHVPELRNRTLAEAREEVADKQLTLVVPPGTPENSRVVEQTLPPGTAVAPGTGLTVTMLAPPATPAVRDDSDSTQRLKLS
jgi:PASTA domain-containing protein